MTNAFDKFVDAQMRSLSFAEAYRHESAQIRALGEAHNDNFPADKTRPVPKFYPPYFVEEIENGKTINKNYPGQTVGLRSNTNCGNVTGIKWIEKFNQWYYTVSPWSGSRNDKWAAESVLMSVRQKQTVRPHTARTRMLARQS